MIVDEYSNNDYLINMFYLLLFGFITINRLSIQVIIQKIIYDLNIMQNVFMINLIFILIIMVMNNII